MLKHALITVSGLILAALCNSCQPHYPAPIPPGANPATHGARLAPHYRPKKTPALNHLPTLPTPGPHRF